MHISNIHTTQLLKVLELERKPVANTCIVLLLSINKLCTIRQKVKPFRDKTIPCVKPFRERELLLLEGYPFTFTLYGNMLKSRKENPQKLTQLSSRSHPRHLVGKRTAQKDTIIDITSDSQVNSNFPNRWSPASLTFNNYFYLFLYLYIT